MSDVPYGAFLVRRASTRRRRGRDGQRSRRRPPTTFTIGFPGHGDLLDERARRRRERPPDRHRAPRHRDGRERLPAELARCIPRLEEPCGIPSAPALLQLSRFAAGAREGRARRPGRRRAARRLRPPPGGGAARRPARTLPAGARRARAPRSPGALPRAARARRAAHLLGGRGDAERLLRSGGDQRRARCARRSLTRRAARRRRPSAWRAPRSARRRAGPRPARAGALPRHPHVPPRRHPHLQRQDVDGRGPRAARAVPRRRADALRRADPGAGRGCGRAPASACTAWRWRGCSRRRSRTARSTASPPPTTTGCAPRSARRCERRYAARLRAGRARRRRPRWRALVAEHRSGRADHKAILYCLLELSEWHRAFVEAR